MARATIVVEGGQSWITGGASVTRTRRCYTPAQQSQGDTQQGNTSVGLHDVLLRVSSTQTQWLVACAISCTFAGTYSSWSPRLFFVVWACSLHRHTTTNWITSDPH